MSPITTSFLLLLASVCDLQSVHAKRVPVQRPKNNFGIHGGKPIKITEVPYMALFRFENITWGCGASIIHEQFLITAGSCTNGMFAKDTSVTVGTDQITGGTKYEIEKWFFHPNYEHTTDYDIAVLKLKKKLVFSDSVKPIKLADSSLQPKVGDLVQTIGFGNTENNDLPSKELLMVRLPYVDREVCKKTYPSEEITERMICAGGEKGKSNCDGDSGGALTYQDQLIGVASWATDPCALAGFPSVFAYVASMRDFIDEVIRNNA